MHRAMCYTGNKKNKSERWQAIAAADTPLFAADRRNISGAVRGVFGAQRGNTGFHWALPAGVHQQSIGAVYCQRAGHPVGADRFHGGLPCAGPCLAAACGAGLGYGAAHPAFAQRPPGLFNGGVRCRRYFQLQLVPGGRHDFPTGGTGQNQLCTDPGPASEPCARPGEQAGQFAGAGGACAAAGAGHSHPGR